MNEFEIFLIGGDEDEKAVATTESVDGECKLTFNYRNKELSAQKLDFFAAFCVIREQLEADGLIPFCYGSSLNVYPSAMCRDMGSGMIAYKTEMGQRVSRDHLVNIFEQGHDVIPSSVSKQKEHFKQWLQSIE
ncbi:hypothetical protein [Marinibactrum halimedae]|uniref:Uncharacterized protein n=1 Tax=Marinibactrum halimedae TaxID=1444977 RepID=A0AA37T7T2_9GAMM|nr:hypothetical protein [Marinibactrum halimedae]MCD9461195.1 hypothetical protein [Marinibactrum halimedae]GLS26417.1 hypothetical protein GCM10007877_21330 [Marinibactrum halimedae]